MVLSGCLDVIGPDTGPALRPSCTGIDSDPGTDIDFTRDIHSGIFERPSINCVACHTARGATPIGLTVGGLDLSTSATLRAGGIHGGASIIVAGDPCASILVQKLTAPPFGARMPLNGPALAPADVQTIVDWIAEGAR
ncbi:MAG: c-type cytochrome domain-containing protein [Kofleriaceae bacterium]